MSDDRPLTFVYEVGGVEVSTSFSVDAAQSIVGWSTSEVILHLGSEGPLLVEGLKKIFGGE